MAAMASMAPEPPTVAVMPATQVTWSGELASVASLKAADSILVSSELAGMVRSIAFESGAKVRRGDALVELDSSMEQAQLEGLEAAAKLAALNLERARDLRAKGTNAQVDLDEAEAVASQASAAVRQLSAVVSKKRIIAPFSGRLGIRRVSTGEYLEPGTPIVSLENSSSLYADFGVPQGNLPLLKPGLSVSLRVDAYPERVFKGVVEAVDPKVSDATRNISVRAVFQNDDLALSGGMFGRVTLDLANSGEVIAIPSAAVVYSSYGNSVYIYDPVAKTVRQQFVTLGASRGDLIAVSKGVSVGEQVVTVGQIKLRNGIPVRINNSVLPDANPAPQPPES